eukprot:8943820-Ditylum_brightwellii.AAC.1
MEWDSILFDGQVLKQMFETNDKVQKMTAPTLKDSFPQYHKYTAKPLNSALQNLKKTFMREVNAQALHRNQIMQSFTNTGFSDAATYISAGDSYYVPVATVAEELSDTVLILSSNGDNFSMISVPTAPNSVIGGRVVQHMSLDMLSIENHKSGTYCGCTSITLSFLLDSWKNTLCRGCISVQVWLLTGEDMYKKTKIRVSTSQRELVLSFPMSVFLSCLDYALKVIPMQQEEFKELGEGTVELVLCHHPNTTARMHSASVIKGRIVTPNFIYTQRIPIPCKVKPNMTTRLDSNTIFRDQKITVYSDKSGFLHVELLV